MRRVIGGIEIDGDTPRATVQSASVPLDDTAGKRVAHLIERRPTHTVLEAGDRRLRRQRRAGNRIAVEQQLLNRILGQPVRVVGIGIAARNAEHALRDELVQGVRNPGRGPGLGQTAGQRGGHAQPRVGRLEQNRTTVRTRVRLIERGHEWLGEQLRKENSLWYRVVAQCERLRGEESLSGNSFLSRGGVCFCTNPQPFVNYSR